MMPKRLSRTMERVLAHAPLDARPIPREIMVSFPGGFEYVRFKTLMALHDREKISLFLKGRPHAKWYWRRLPS